MAALNRLAEVLDRRPLPHPLRVAIDGRTASGKTMLADELAGCLRDRGRNVIRTSIDGFHRPRAERYRKGRLSAEGYYCDARDLDALRDLLLDPLGPGGSLLYATASFDLAADSPLEPSFLKAGRRDILIVDGTFLQRPELASCWDFTLFVDVPQQLARSRGIRRDAALLGGIEATSEIYDRRYCPAFQLYEAESRPRDRATALWNNADFELPSLTFRVPGDATE